MDDEKRITRQYIADLIADFRISSRQLDDAEKNKTLWEGRIKTASQAGREDLAISAQEKAAESEALSTSLQSHMADLRTEIAKAKSELKTLEKSPDLSIDPEALLADLETLTAGNDPLENDFKLAEAEAALELLKKKMKL